MHQCPCIRTCGRIPFSGVGQLNKRNKPPYFVFLSCLPRSFNLGGLGQKDEEMSTTKLEACQPNLTCPKHPNTKGDHLLGSCPKTGFGQVSNMWNLTGGFWKTLFLSKGNCPVSKPSAPCHLDHLRAPGPRSADQNPFNRRCRQAAHLAYRSPGTNISWNPAGAEPWRKSTVDGQNQFRTTWKSWETIVCWYLQGNRIIPWLLSLYVLPALHQKLLLRAILSKPENVI